MSLAEWQEYRALDRQVRDLEKQQRGQAGAGQNWDSYQFVACPTCPPSTRLFVRGGNSCWIGSVYEGINFYLHDGYLDVAEDTASIGPEWPYICQEAYAYLPMYLAIDNYEVLDTLEGGYADPLFRLFGPEYSADGGGFVEFSTRLEAENAIDAVYAEYSQDQVLWNAFPVCRLVLRNNGITGVAGQWLPIDAVNRGGSYLWGQFRNGRYTS